MNILYDYLFHYNPYEKMWYAFKREDYRKYFNDTKKTMLRDPDINDLITKILIETNAESDETET